MIAHLVAMVGIITAIVLCTLLPFLPGRYDPLAVPLSAIAQISGAIGLVLVPIGVIWFVSRYSSELARKQRTFAIAALVTGSLVWLILSLVGLVHSGFALGIAVISLWALAAWRLSRRLTILAAASVAPTYVIVVPLAVATVQFVIDEPITEFSRSRAIRNSAGLIADIERYHEAHGQYPLSLVSLWKDYSPSIIGVKEFQYERQGDAYNVLFEPFTFRLGTREIVMYNPRDEQVMTSHDSDRLQLRPEQLEYRRGYYAVHDAPHPHWKYFWFD